MCTVGNILAEAWRSGMLLHTACGIVRHTPLHWCQASQRVRPALRSAREENRAMYATDAICGMLLPIPTVFDDTGEVDAPLMRKLTRCYLNAGWACRASSTRAGPLPQCPRRTG